MTRTRISQNFWSQNVLPVIVVWKRSSIEPEEILNRWWSNMYRSETAFCHKKCSWWTVTRGQVLVYGMRHSVRIPMIFTMREGLLVKCIDWPLFCIEQHSDNVRKITLQLILNVSSDCERSSGLAALWRKSSIWFSDQFFGQNWWNFGWCHVLMACLTTYRISQYCWRLKMIIICRKGIVQVIILLDVTGRN